MAQKWISEMEHPPPFPWFGSEWLLAVSKNKDCLTGTKISAHWIRKEIIVKALKAVPQQRQQHHWDKYIATRGEYLKGDPSR
jgi:hypothetical protein